MARKVAKAYGREEVQGGLSRQMPQARPYQHAEALEETPGKLDGLKPHVAGLPHEMLHEHAPRVMQSLEHELHARAGFNAQHGEKE